MLEQKEIEPIFVPSSDKTNFDATYDLEELLLEEAPLEARARRQKPRERLKEDATQQEIREDELYRMIEKDFRQFDYTVAAYKKCVARPPPASKISANRGLQDHGGGGGLAAESTPDQRVSDAHDGRHQHCLRQGETPATSYSATG